MLLLGKEKAIETLVVLGHFPTNLLGVDLLKTESWTDEGTTQTFVKETHHLSLLGVAPTLPHSFNQCQALPLYPWKQVQITVTDYLKNKGGIDSSTFFL